MDNRNMASEMTIPEEWHPTDDWSSHRPMLYMTMLVTGWTVIEFGCGNGSTKLLADLCTKQNRHFYSFETNKQWSDMFPVAMLIPSYDHAFPFFPCSLLFIDHAPGELRKYY